MHCRGVQTGLRIAFIAGYDLLAPGDAWLSTVSCCATWLVHVHLCVCTSAAPLCFCQVLNPKKPGQ